MTTTLPARAGRALAVLASGAVLTLLAPLQPAQATNFGSTVCGGTPRNCVSLGDNATHAWYPEGKLGNQIPGIDTAVASAMASYDRATDLRMVRSQNASQDVLVTDASYGDNGIYGWVECLPGSATSGTHPRVRCDRQKLRFNDEYSVFLTAGEKLSLACHEIGHTVGLRHTPDTSSCMSISDTWPRTTNAHDHAHLNAIY